MLAFVTKETGTLRLSEALAADISGVSLSGRGGVPQIYQVVDARLGTCRECTGGSNDCPVLQILPKMRSQ